MRVRLWLLQVFAFAVVLLGLLPGSIPAATSVQPVADCIVSESGDLIEAIRSNADHLPGQDTNGMVVPTTAQMAAWEQLIDGIEAGNLQSACDVLVAQGFPYHLVRFTDTGNKNKSYLLLREDLPISVGWGSYVVSLDHRRDVVIEVPHPSSELRTEDEGIELFRQLDARAFLMAGTDRCANTSYSPCTGTTTFCGQEEPHRTSDVAHATQTIFHASHRALVEPGSDLVAVQVHGCSQPECPDLFISNATCEPGGLSERLYRNAQIACEHLEVDLADCTPPECPLVGTTNVQGRFSNGSFWLPTLDACAEFASRPSQPEQFLHLEQSSTLRQDFTCLTVALRMTFSDLQQSYLPLSSRRAEARATGVQER